MKYQSITLLTLTAFGLSLSSSRATVAFTDDFTSSAGWIIAGGSDTASTFNYDYSADGIPSAPNGSGTTGLKLEANLANGVADEIAAVHSLGFSGTPYRVTFDMWTNFSIADGGSTEFSGGGVGHDGTTAGRNGAVLIVTGDGGSSRDYRLYKDDGEQFFASLQYGPTLASNNGSDPALAAAFLGLPAPGAQGQIGSSNAGSTAFQWLTMQIDVDPNAVLQGTTADTGTARFTLMSHTSGLSVEIGTIDNSNGGTVVNMEGNLALIHADLFSSLAGDPQFQFSIYDNLLVETIPEPSAGGLALLGIAGLLLRRRR
jgi:hypothetical protein